MSVNSTTPHNYPQPALSPSLIELQNGFLSRLIAALAPGWEFAGASYGNHCYYILMPEDIILEIGNDINEENSSFIIYDSRKGKPTRIPMEVNNELV